MFNSIKASSIRILLLAVCLFAPPFVVAQTATEYETRGIEKAQKGDLDGALGDFDRAIKLAPKSAPAYYNRGIVRKAKGDLDGAIYRVGDSRVGQWSKPVSVTVGG